MKNTCYRKSTTIVVEFVYCQKKYTMDTIKKVERVEVLIAKLLEKYAAEGSNINRIPSPFIQEALRLKDTAPFLDIDSYMYFLSEMSVLILDLGDGVYATFYGLDDWEEGLNIFDYPIPEENGFHLVLDICNADGAITYFSYNSENDNEDILWISTNVEDGPYTKSDLSFVDVLQSIYDNNWNVV